ncbi:MAG: helix-turn-helix transcriptional regulator [Bacilli bacterium]|nr:helix-turn-helix transcriptional regulator [Bacilli bacterium]
MLLGKRIKSLRLDRGLTQKELGDMMGVTKVTIHCYENDKRMPTIDTLIALAEIFNVDINYLLGTDYHVIADKDSKYGVKMAEEEIKFIKTIRNYDKLYDYLINDPKRFAELIAKKLR